MMMMSHETMIYVICHNCPSSVAVYACCLLCMLLACDPVVAHVIFQLLRSFIICREILIRSYCVCLLLGVVVGVSELLLMSLAKMTVQVGKAVGQAVGDAKVCHYLSPSLYVIPSHCLPHYMSLPLSLYVTASLIVYITASLYVAASLTVCHCLPYCMSLPPSLYVIASLIVCHCLAHCMSLPPLLYVTVSLTVCHCLPHCILLPPPHCTSSFPFCVSLAPSLFNHVPPSLYIIASLIVCHSLYITASLIPLLLSLCYYLPHCMLLLPLIIVTACCMLVLHMHVPSCR